MLGVLWANMRRLQVAFRKKNRIIIMNSLIYMSAVPEKLQLPLHIMKWKKNKSEFSYSLALSLIIKVGFEFYMHAI